MWLFLLGTLQEYLVTVNLYNGNLFSFVDEIIEYCLIDLFLLIIMCIRWKKHNIIEFSGILLTFIAHLQWYVHSPFSDWPEWWPAEKTQNDIRHRTEYYDTHVMCFVIYSILFIRFYDKRYYDRYLIR